jgi:hypothetical protein
MNSLDKEDLAFHYLRGDVSKNDKRSVFELLQLDEEFVEIMKTELQLMKRLGRLRKNLSEESKGRLWEQMRNKVENDDTAGRSTGVLHYPWTDWILKKTLPAPAFQTIQLLKRRY